MEQSLSLEDLKLSDEELGEKLLKLTYSGLDMCPDNLRKDFESISENPFIQWQRLEYLLKDVGVESSSIIDMPSLEFLRAITYGVYTESGFEIEFALIPQNLNRKKNPVIVAFRVWAKETTFEVLHVVQIAEVWKKRPRTNYEKTCDSMDIAPYSHIN